MDNTWIELVMPSLPALFATSLGVNKNFIEMIGNFTPFQFVFVGEFGILLNFETDKIVLFEGPCFTFGHCYVGYVIRIKKDRSIVVE